MKDSNDFKLFKAGGVIKFFKIVFIRLSSSLVRLLTVILVNLFVHQLLVVFFFIFKRANKRNYLIVYGLNELIQALCLE